MYFMTEYRIATNGDRYRIEKRGFLGRWERVSSERVLCPSGSEAILPAHYMGYMSETNSLWDHRDLSQTQDVLRLIIEFDTWTKHQKSKKWRSL